MDMLRKECERLLKFDPRTRNGGDNHLPFLVHLLDGVWGDGVVNQARKSSSLRGVIVVYQLVKRGWQGRLES